VGLLRHRAVLKTPYERRLTPDSLGECNTQLTVSIPFYLIIINLVISYLEKEGIYIYYDCPVE